MATPNDGLITETNRQYYEGAQGFIASGGDFYPTSFNTDLVYFSYNPADPNYALNNFKVFTSSPSNAGAPGTFRPHRRSPGHAEPGYRRGTARLRRQERGPMKTQGFERRFSQNLHLFRS